jgi:hypothetical protein
MLYMPIVGGGKMTPEEIKNIVHGNYSNANRAWQYGKLVYEVWPDDANTTWDPDHCSVGEEHDASGYNEFARGNAPIMRCYYCRKCMKMFWKPK